MDFCLSEEQNAIYEMACQFGETHIRPYALEWERSATIPRELWARAAELGLGGIFIPEQQGGAGLNRLDATLVFEALARSCPSVSAFLSIHNMCVGMIGNHGSRSLQERFLDAAIGMECILSYCLTEPGSGSDAAALSCRAHRTNSGWELTGTKSFISGGGYSDAYIVMCRTGDSSPAGISAVVVEDGMDGLSFGGLEDKMGWRAQPTRQVQLDQCPIPLANLIGDEGMGFRYAMSGLDGGRLNIAACSLGGAQSAFDATRDYMHQRRAFGKSLVGFQALQFRLADMATELHAARLMLHEAATRVDRGDRDATVHCAMAKRYCTDIGFRVANECLQLHGGYGYLAETGIEKIVRDLRVHQILEGTNEIMRVIISRSLIDESGKNRAREVR